jgi:hypothetical protein
MRWVGKVHKVDKGMNDVDMLISKVDSDEVGNSYYGDMYLHVDVYLRENGNEIDVEDEGDLMWVNRFHETYHLRVMDYNVDKGNSDPIPPVKYQLLLILSPRNTTHPSRFHVA